MERKRKKDGEMDLKNQGVTTKRETDGSEVLLKKKKDPDEGEGGLRATGKPENKRGGEDQKKKTKNHPNRPTQTSRRG